MCLFIILYECLYHIGTNTMANQLWTFTHLSDINITRKLFHWILLPLTFQARKMLRRLGAQGLRNLFPIVNGTTHRSYSKLYEPDYLAVSDSEYYIQCCFGHKKYIIFCISFRCVGAETRIPHIRAFKYPNQRIRFRIAGELSAIFA